jgi:hypothetical protein
MVKGQGHWVKFLQHHILVNTRIKILQWILTKLGTYLVLRRVEPYWLSRSLGKFFTVWHPCEHFRINFLQWILTKLGAYIVLRRVWNPIDFQGQRSRGRIFTLQHPCEHSRINILHWILTKLGTYLVLRRVWNPIDFQGHRVKLLQHHIFVNTLESRSCNGFCDLELM